MDDRHSCNSQRMWPSRKGMEQTAGSGSSRAREFHPHPLTEPCVKVSPHTALHTQFFVHRHNLGGLTSLPMIEKTTVFARYLLQPTESLDNGLAVEALVFPAYPIGKHHVQVVHHFDILGLSQMVLLLSSYPPLCLRVV